MIIDAVNLAEGAEAFKDLESQPEIRVELLIVDDQELIRESLRRIFQADGYKVSVAEGGEVALNFLKKQPVELILLDLNMPDVNGHEVLRFIADNRLGTQVIVVSGEANFEEARRSLRFNFVLDFIKKPYEIKGLKHIVSKAKKMIRLEEENQRMLKRLHSSEQMHRFLVENSPDIIFLVDQYGNFTFLNKAIKGLLGYKLADVVGKHYTKLIYQEDWGKAEAVFKSTPVEHNPITAELRLQCQNKDEYRYVEVTSLRINPHAIDAFKQRQGDYKALPKIFGVIRNIHERKKVENELLKLHLAIDNSPNFIFITDCNGVIEYANQKINDTTGYCFEEVVGKTPRIFGIGTANIEFYRVLWNTISSGQVWRGVLKNRKKSGEFYWARESIAPVINAEGIITHYVSIQEDVTEARLLTEKLSYQASHDSVTHLINRQEFDQRLERVIASAQTTLANHALCYLDLDQFKIINDTCSHTAGDELLRQISYLLLQVLRGNDTLARLGGDEFAILMENCPLESAAAMTEKIHQVIENHQFVWDGKIFRIGVSIGLVLIDCNRGGSDFHMKQADMACFMAKESGRNRTHIYREDDKALAQHHGEMNWAVRINDAFEQNLFCLYKQAIVPLGNEEGEHCEILIRIKDADGECIPAGVFLPAAERFQLITKIDRWVIRNVFDYFTEDRKRLENLSLCSINLSGASLSDINLLDFIESEFLRTAMPAGKVCFEITETAAIANLTHAIELISRLKELGSKFSLDDFGSGLSSFAYLKHLPVDFLKIDGFFVKNIENDSVDLAMIKSINDIGHILGKKTIAEFVETQSIYQKLNGLEVDYAQGYFTGRPVPLRETAEFCPLDTA